MSGTDADSQQNGKNLQTGGDHRVSDELRRTVDVVGEQAKHSVDRSLNDLDAGAEDEQQDIVIHANYELFVAGVLILQLVNSALLLIPLRSQQREIVYGFWLGITLFLIADALYRLRRSHNRRRAFSSLYGWMTWVGSMPIPFVTSARLFGMAFAVRKLRRGEVREVGRVVVSRHAQSTLLLVIFAAMLVFEFGSLMILAAEDVGPDANITTSSDALWWSLVTISTVGYGDTFPTTLSGRLIGVLMIVAGVGLFTSVTSFLSQWFIKPRASTQHPLHPPQNGPSEQIGEIRALLEQMQTAHKDTVSELEERLAQLEQSVTDQASD